MQQLGALRKASNSSGRRPGPRPSRRPQPQPQKATDTRFPLTAEDGRLGQVAEGAAVMVDGGLWALGAMSEPPE